MNHLNVQVDELNIQLNHEKEEVNGLNVQLNQSYIKTVYFYVQVNAFMLFFTFLGLSIKNNISSHNNS